MASERDVKRISRTKTGCLTCRYKKRKCDETVPVCKKCIKSDLECVWPDHRNQSLAKSSFQPKRSTAKNLIFEVACVKGGQITLSREETPIYGPHLLKGLQFSGLNWISGVTLDPESAMLFRAFLEGFLPSITPQFTDGRLLPAGIAIPLLPTSAAFREVCFTCGAAWLMWKNPSVSVISDKRYKQCMKRILEEIRSQNIDGSEDWLVFSLLNLSLREKYCGAGNVKCTHHLIAAYQILQKRKREWLNKQNNHRLDSNFDILKFEQYITEPSRHEESNKFLVFGDEDNPMGKTTHEELVISCNDKYVTDSFAYNYSVKLLVCTDEALQRLPSPFVFFDEFRDVLCKPLLPMPLEWMNNSIMGAARDAFEVVAKASWLSRVSPLDDISRKRAELLYDMTAHESLMFLPPESCADLKEEERFHLNCSLITNALFLKAAHLLLTKVLYPNTSTSDDLIQKDVELIMDYLELIPPYHPICSALPWPIMVAGSASLLSIHRKYLIERTLEIGDYVHTQYSCQIIDFFKKAWGTGEEEGMGCDILLHRESLEKLCL